MNFSVHFSVHLKKISKGSMPKSGPINNLDVFLWDNVLNIINFLGESLEFFYLQQYSNDICIFLIKNMPRNLGFYDRKMN